MKSNEIDNWTSIGLISHVFASASVVNSLRPSDAYMRQ